MSKLLDRMSAVIADFHRLECDLGGFFCFVNEKRDFDPVLSGVISFAIHNGKELQQQLSRKREQWENERNRLFYHENTQEGGANRAPERSKS